MKLDRGYVPLSTSCPMHRVKVDKGYVPLSKRLLTVGETKYVGHAFFAAVGAEGVGFRTGFLGCHGEFLEGADYFAAFLAVYQLEGFSPDGAGFVCLGDVDGAGGADVGAASAADADGAFFVVGSGDLFGDAAVDGGDGSDGELGAGFYAQAAHYTSTIIDLYKARDVLYLVFFAQGPDLRAVGCAFLKQCQDHAALSLYLFALREHFAFLFHRIDAGDDDLFTSPLGYFHDAKTAGSLSGEAVMVAEGRDLDPVSPGDLKKEFSFLTGTGFSIDHNVHAFSLPLV